MGNQVRGKGKRGNGQCKVDHRQNSSVPRKREKWKYGCPDLLWRNAWFISLNPTVKLEACHVCLYGKTGHSLLNSTTPSNNSCLLLVLSLGYQEFKKIDLLINIILSCFHWQNEEEVNRLRFSLSVFNNRTLQSLL